MGEGSLEFGSKDYSLPNMNSYHVKKGRKRSLDEADRSKWTSNCSMEMGENRGIIDDFWNSANGTFGLERLFIDRKMCPNKTKVYQKRPARAGAQTGVNVVPRKRKASSLPRLEQTNPTKTAFCCRDHT